MRTGRIPILKSDPVVRKVQHTITRFGMLKPKDRVVVAVSGGPDSVCLVSVLHALSKDLDITLHIAHLDHMFRGKESADEALFVAGLATKLGIPSTIEKTDVPAFCRERGLSPQEGARLARYDFLQRVAQSTGTARIATGHTADDQAETLIMRLLRGAGVTGLSAIPPVRKNIIRPLLETTRHDIQEHLRQNGLEFVTDPSNAKPVYTRNRVRLDVLPVLKRFNPRIIETLSGEAALLKDEDESMEDCVSKLASNVIIQEEAGVILKREEFNALPRAFRRRLLRKAMDLAVAEPPALSSSQTRALSSVQIDEALAFMAVASTGRSMHLPFDITIEREYEQFIVSAQRALKKFSRVLALPGTTSIPEIGMTVKTSVLKTGGAESETDMECEGNYLWQAEFDYDKICTPLLLRSRLPGDRFRPAGMGGRSKKVQDYFVDEKVPRRKRDAVPLVVSGNDVLWVVGLRTDNRYLPGEQTKSILTIRMRNE
jgi:tRNA(Ile)-lysidine synthase